METKYTVEDGRIYLPGSRRDKREPRPIAEERQYRAGYRHGFLAALEYLETRPNVQAIADAYGMQAFTDLIEWANTGELMAWLRGDCEETVLPPHPEVSRLRDSADTDELPF